VAGRYPLEYKIKTADAALCIVRTHLFKLAHFSQDTGDMVVILAFEFREHGVAVLAS